MFIPTMAVQINEVTYPIAVACLAPGFAANHKESDAYGCYLVINELESRRFENSGDAPVLVLSNCWMDEDRFNETYRFVAGPETNQFTLVERV